MKPIGNIAKYLDLRKPASQEDIRQALARAHADQRPKSLSQVARAGYGLEFLQPTAIAKACGTSLRALPHFVKDDEADEDVMHKAQAAQMRALKG